MREFQIARYLRKWWWIIALLSALSGIFFYTAISSRQTYKAKVLIEFTNSKASEGLYPTGDKIDVNEIKSSSVILAALEDIGRNESVDSVRKRTSITAVISDEDSAIQAAKWNKGETYEFFPTQYIITYESARNESSSDARRVLEAIVDSYVQLYSTKYISLTKVPNNVESLQNLNYDYIEWAEIIDSFITSAKDYLSTMKDRAKGFRASTSGYSFQDLYNEYNIISSIYLPSLYSIILTNHVTTDPKLLISRYEYRKSQNDLALKNYTEALDVVETMLHNYSEKNSEMMTYQQGDGENASGSSSTTILNSIIRPENYTEDLNTYDSVLSRYIKLRSDIQQKQADNEYCAYVFSAFREEDGRTLLYSKSEDDIKEVENLIDFIHTRLETLDKLLNMTAAEHLNVETMKNIQVRSTVNVRETVNVKLYTVLIVAVFFIFGVLLAIVLGRSLDFVDYHFFTDSTTGLPNHMKCDSEIAQYDKKTLPIPFTVTVVALSNMNEINAAVGRDGGNEVLRLFAGMLKSSAETFGFVAYNGSLTFMCLFSSCDETRSTYFKNVLKRAVAEFNLAGHGVSIRYKLSSATATENKSRTIRELISMAMSQLRLEKEIIAEEEE